MIVYKPPSDKSITIRCLVLAAISGERILVKNPLLCDDTFSSIKALKKLGCRVSYINNNFEIKGPGLYGFKRNISINVGESGLFLRLILPILLNQNGRYKISGKKTILRRNFKDTIQPFIKLGANIKHSKWHLPFIIYSSKISNGSFETNSAQVKSSLLIASLYGSNIWVREISKLRDHTENILKYLGVRIMNDGGFIKTNGNIKPKDFEIYGDVSSASAIITVAVLKRIPIKVKECFLNKRRLGFFYMLKKAGVSVHFDVKKKIMNEPVGNIEIIPSKKFFSVSIYNISDMIDEIPLACLILSHAEGVSEIHGISRISNKESDRLRFVIDMLKELGSFVSYEKDTLIIKGGRLNKIRSIETDSDHRIAMVGGVIKAINNPLVKIIQSSCVSKTYPQFWEDMERLFGVKI